MPTKRVLMRGEGMLADPECSMSELLLGCLADSSAGSVLYGKAMLCLLRSAGYTVDLDSCAAEKGEISAEEAGRISAVYDAYVLPLGGIFRAGCADQLSGLTAFIEKLRIPCIVMGVGVRKPLDDSKLVSEDESAIRSFVQAVLSKSAVMGVHGEETAGYLEHLGFAREKDFLVIGHPGMIGFDLPSVSGDAPLTADSTVALSASPDDDDEVLTWMKGLADAYGRAFSVVEDAQEFRRVYLGDDGESGSNLFEQSMQADDRERLYVSADAWIHGMETVDVCVSTRVAPAIAAMRAGVLTLMVPADTWSAEIAAYHGVPCVSREDAVGSTDIAELMPKAQKPTTTVTREEAFGRVCECFARNGLGQPMLAEAASWQEPEDVQAADTIAPIAGIGKDDAVKRLNEFYREETTRLAGQVSTLGKRIAEQDKIIGHAAAELESARFIRTSLNTRIEAVEMVLEKLKK